jgi:hypothetical protein
MDFTTNIDNSSDKLIERLQESFVNDYDFWKNVINEVNSGIEIYKNNDKQYNYDEFCIKFIDLMNKKLQDTEFSHSTINFILTKMIYEKIQDPSLLNQDNKEKED